MYPLSASCASRRLAALLLLKKRVASCAVLRYRQMKSARMIASSRGVIVALLPVFFLPSRFVITALLTPPLRSRFDPPLDELRPLLAQSDAPGQHVQSAGDRRDHGYPI